MSNKNKIRHILLKQYPNKLLNLLFEIMKNKNCNSFNKYPHILSKSLQIFWSLHSDLNDIIYKNITNDTFWKSITNILSSKFIIINKRNKRNTRN